MMCDLEGCIKRGQSACTGTNGKLYCTMTHLKEDGAKQSEEAKAKKVSSKVCSLLLLLVSLATQLTPSPFVSNRSCRAPGQCQEQCREVLGTSGDEAED